MSKAPAVKREATLKARDEQALQDYLLKDKIVDFENFKRNYGAKVDRDKWMVQECLNHICFMRVESVLESSAPYVNIAFKIMSDLTIKIFHRDSDITSIFKHLFGNGFILEKWSIFENLFSQLLNFDYADTSPDEKMSHIFNCLDELMEEKSGINFHKYCILKEQILV